MIHAAILTVLMAVQSPILQAPVPETEPKPEMVKTYRVEKIVLHEEYEIVHMRGADVYQRSVRRSFEFYYKGEKIETLNDNGGKLRPLRVGGEWWLIVTVGNEQRIVRTTQYEYLSTIKSDKDVETQVESCQEA
jgi:hypothetical protein